MRLGLRYHGAVQRRGCQRGHGRVLGINDVGDEEQIIGDRVAVSQLAYARSALGKQAGGAGQKHARKVDAVQAFDFAGLKNTLHVGYSQKNDRRHALKSVPAVLAKRS